ncbi:hypothetical protein PITCH_A190003 [uncultured Desulfobacterium sp.]|uniref:Uncharacterized protein n=1 Tax=uncultured Desulfobacterium sp. TaxID=201089 RepID=A0A445MV89_9BACT|nr:hypothetical protein PITCH_A190003 [uncultured Desulfobacterium sp.]
MIIRVGRKYITQNPQGGLSRMHDLAIGKSNDLPTLASDIVLTFNEVIEVLPLTEFSETIDFQSQLGRSIKGKVNEIRPNLLLWLKGAEPCLV